MEFTECTRYSGVHRRRWRRWSRLEVCAIRCTMVDIRTYSIIHDCSYMYPWKWMYLWNGKITRRLWDIKAHNQEWNITRSLEFGSEISLRMENNITEQENNKMTFPNEEGWDEWGMLRIWEIWFKDLQSVNIQLCLNVCTVVSVFKH